MLFRLGATPSSRSFPCEPEVCVFSLRAVFLLALLMLISVYIFSSFVPPHFFDFDLDCPNHLLHPVLFL